MYWDATYNWCVSYSDHEFEKEMIVEFIIVEIKRIVRCELIITLCKLPKILKFKPITILCSNVYITQAVIHSI